MAGGSSLMVGGWCLMVFLFGGGSGCGGLMVAGSSSVSA